MITGTVHTWRCRRVRWVAAVEFEKYKLFDDIQNMEGEGFAVADLLLLLLNTWGYASI